MGISIWQLAIVLAIVLLLFGTKKLRNVGSDLGSAIRSFRGAVKDNNNDADKAAEETTVQLEQGEENTTAEADAKVKAKSEDHKQREHV